MEAAAYALIGIAMIAVGRYLYVYHKHRDVLGDRAGDNFVGCMLIAEGSFYVVCVIGWIIFWLTN